MTIIVTHTSPDFDAIGGCWLLQRYGGFSEAEIAFVNTGNPDRAVLDAAGAVVDTGRDYDPARLRFDHHHLPMPAANETCAAKMVFSYLRFAQPAKGWSYLAPLVDLILAGDTGKPEANESRLVGIHALLSARKAKRVSDSELLAYGYELLDALAAHAEQSAIARASVGKHTVYRSDDGLVVALRDAPQGTTFAAYEQGARLVLFQSSMPDVPTNAIGIRRGGENQEPHAGNLVGAVIETMEYYSEHIAGATGALYDELCTWYRHEAGFFVGRGTLKAPDPRPIVVELADLARRIDCAWER